MIRNSAGYFQLESFNREKGLRHGISGRFLGNLSFRWGDQETVSLNRRNFFRAVGVGRGKVVTLNLKHGDNIAVVKEMTESFLGSVPWGLARHPRPDPRFHGDGSRLDSRLRGNDRSPAACCGESSLEADAVITNQKRTFLFFPLGDCYPILFFDPIKKAVGLAHVGWRGAVANLHLKVIEKMEKEFGTSVSNLIIGFGPGICEKCNHQLRPLVQEGRAEWRPYLRDLGKSKVRVDLLGYCRDSLIVHGVKRERIEISGICTAENFSDFFSERAVKTGADPEPMGRFGAIIGIK